MPEYSGEAFFLFWELSALLIAEAASDDTRRLTVQHLKDTGPCYKSVSYICLKGKMILVIKWDSRCRIFWHIDRDSIHDRLY